MMIKSVNLVDKKIKIIFSTVQLQSNKNNIIVKIRVLSPQEPTNDFKYRYDFTLCF